MIPTGQIAAAMAQLAATREDLIVDEGRATRPGSVGATPVLDPDTLQPTTPAASQVYVGPGTVADPKTGSQAARGGRTSNDDTTVPNSRILRLPNGSPDLRPGDLWTVTVARFSPSLVGDVFVVLGEEERSYATYRRYVVRGSSWL